MTSPTPEQIREARAKAGLTLDQAAAILGVHRMTWWKWETGRHEMPAGMWGYWQLLQERLETITKRKSRKVAG